MIPTTSRLPGILNPLLVTPQLGEILLDVLSTNCLSTLSKLLKERSKLVLQMVIRHYTLDSADTINVSKGTLAALEQTAAAVGRAAVFGPIIRNRWLVRLFFLEELWVGDQEWEA